MTLVARHLLLAALLLRAIVPLGWMPGSAQLGQSAWIICTADGGIQHGAPGKEDSHHQQQTASLAAPLLQRAALETLVAPAAMRIAATFTPQAPRAPPLSA
jgi:hypothetical protein